MAGLKRSPYPSPDFEPITEHDRDSRLVFDEVLTPHDEWAKAVLRLAESIPFEITPEAIASRGRQLTISRESVYARTRDVRQLAQMIGATVTQMEEEVRGETVLDVGCGKGRFGEAIARNAKAKVTFLDSDEEVLSNITRKSGNKVVADARALPFEDESFQKVFSTFAAVTWAETPSDAVQSLNEAIRVTEVGGTHFLLPAFSNVTQRPVVAARSEMDPLEYDDALAHGVWAMQDHVVFRALTRLIEEGFCDISWRSFVGRGSTTNVQMESFSAIIDKNEPVPADLLAENLAYADQFTVAGS